MTQHAYGHAVDTIRRAGLAPTRDAILVAKLVLDRKEPASLDDLLDDARDSGYGLSRETLAATLEQFRHVGLAGAVTADASAIPDANAPVGDPDAAAALLRAMGNPWRYRILCLLSRRSLSVGALQQELDLTQSGMSQHLARLRQMGLVRTRRRGQRIVYSLASPAVADLVATMCSACRDIVAHPA